ncbi:MAG: Spy/CpxP family protein refolding chaperone [Candidatus Poribacteria bacterium]|nr:Spy/CpxP family protein refolding chaperone [Candidatus Poribacteria bacterium]
MKRKVFASTLVALLIIGVIASTALSRPFGRHERGMHFPVELREKLSEEQVKQLQSLQLEVQKSMIALRSQIQIKRLEMHQLWMAESLDEDAILQKTQEISALESQRHEKRVRHRLEVAKILTKEQREAWMQSAHSKPERRRGDGPDRRRRHHRRGEPHRDQGHHHGDAPKNNG